MRRNAACKRVRARRLFFAAPGRLPAALLPAGRFSGMITRRKGRIRKNRERDRKPNLTESAYTGDYLYYEIILLRDEKQARRRTGMDKWLESRELPNHLVAACGLVRRDGRVLLIRNRLRGWELPGGTMEQGETVTEALKREIYEESGILCEPEQLAGVYQNLTLKDGYGPLEGMKVPPVVNLAFLCRYTGGEPSVSDEAEDVRWVSPEEAVRMVTHPLYAKRLADLLEAGEAVVFSSYEYDNRTAVFRTEERLPGARPARSAERAGNPVQAPAEGGKQEKGRQDMKIFYDDGTVRIRNMVPEDAGILYRTYLSYGWHPELKTYEEYFREQENGQRQVFIAEYEGSVAGICTLVMNPSEGPLAGRGWPEIVDLCVFFHVHRKGIGSRLLDVAEQEAARTADHVFLAVGVHSGYGPAQRLYVSRGYNFDGSGVWYKGKQLEQYAPCCNDDDLLLFMFRKL